VSSALQILAIKLWRDSGDDRCWLPPIRHGSKFFCQSSQLSSRKTTTLSKFDPLKVQIFVKIFQAFSFAGFNWDQVYFLLFFFSSIPEKNKKEQRKTANA
jgi:hypothetical protein